MNRKELKKLIKAHEIKQICSMPLYNLADLRVHIIYRNNETNELYYVKWSCEQHKALCLINNCSIEQLENMEKELKYMHRFTDIIEKVHILYNKCTDTMNSNSATMDEKMVAKYTRKACDFFIHDRRFSLNEIH